MASYMQEKVAIPGAGSETSTQTSAIPPRISSDTFTSSEHQREHAQKSAPNGFSNPNSGVSVADAEAEFAQLQRELSGISEKSRLSRRNSRSSRHEKTASEDVEKISSTQTTEHNAEPFDLEATLRGGREEEQEAGIKPKRIGVIWEDLKVTGTGGVTNFVKTFPG